LGFTGYDVGPVKIPDERESILTVDLASSFAKASKYKSEAALQDLPTAKQTVANDPRNT
jgi:hypothetical protein